MYNKEAFSHALFVVRKTSRVHLDCVGLLIHTQEKWLGSGLFDRELMAES